MPLKEFDAIYLIDLCESVAGSQASRRREKKRF
jgi:hypothetical protein